MSTATIRSKDATADARVGKVDMKLEVITIPVSDVDRAKEFYGVSAGGSTPTSATAVNARSSSRLRAPSARFTWERMRPDPPRASS
jgi:hypothetical protein